eukprot:g26054.t1
MFYTQCGRCLELLPGVEVEAGTSNCITGTKSYCDAVIVLPPLDQETWVQMPLAPENEVPPGECPTDVVGQPLAHLSSIQQATGEAIYCDDLPRFENELYLALVTSTEAHAKISCIVITMRV